MKNVCYDRVEQSSSCGEQAPDVPEIQGQQSPSIYKRASTKASKEVRSITLKKLAENTKNDSKSFFAYVCGRSNSIRKVGPLVNRNGEVVDSSEGMSKLFN